MTTKFLHALVFMAFMVQSMIPAGFMVSARADDTGGTIVICAGGGEQVIKDTTTSGPDQKSAHPTSPCPYAYTGFGIAMPSMVVAGDIMTRLIPARVMLFETSPYQMGDTHPPAIGPPLVVLI